MTADVKHYEDCKQLFMSVGQSYLVEALLEFFKMEDVSKLPKENSLFLVKDGNDEEKEIQILAVLDKFVQQYICSTSEEDSMESSDDDNTDGVFNSVNSKLDWNDNLAAIFEAKLTFNRPSSSVPFYCFCQHG